MSLTKEEAADFSGPTYKDSKVTEIEISVSITLIKNNA
jgi:hypothetical protein